MKPSVTAGSIDDTQIYLPSRPQLLLTNGAIDVGTVTSRSATANTAVSAAEALELVEELHETVMFRPTVEMISLLTSSLGTTNCSSLLLAKHPFKPRSSPQLSSNVDWKKTFDPITILASLTQS